MSGNIKIIYKLFQIIHPQIVVSWKRKNIVDAEIFRNDLIQLFEEEILTLLSICTSPGWQTGVRIALPCKHCLHTHLAV